MGVVIVPNVPDVMMNLLGEYLSLRHKLLEQARTSSPPAKPPKEASAEIYNLEGYAEIGEPERTG